MKEWDESCVKLDRTFANEIKKQANGDGSREAKFAYRAKVKEVSGMLSTTKVEEIFDECIKKHGRVPVAICVAATIIERRRPASKKEAVAVIDEREGGKDE